MAKAKVLICPYCGETQQAAEACRACAGLFEPLSRQATHNEMGPWFIRNPDRPFQPGCSYETLIKLIERGQVTKFSIIRGPTTKQFWTIARRVPGVSHLLGFCHNCDASVDVGDHGCHACGVPFGAYLDRNYLGLPEVRPLPWEPPVEDEERRGMGAGRTLDFRRAAEPLGISSFASDQELRGGGTAAPPMQSGPASLGTVGATSAGAATMPSNFIDHRLGFTAASPESVPVSIAAQTAQRTVQQQRKMIRLLAVGVIGLAIVATIAVVIMIANGRGGDSNSVENSANAGHNAIPVAPIQETIDTESAGGIETTSDVVESSNNAMQPPVIDVNILLARAQENIGLAEQEEASTPDRIEAYEEALRLLREVSANAPADQKPDDLDDRVKSVERALNDLRLKVYFP